MIDRYTYINTYLERYPSLQIDIYLSNIRKTLNESTFQDLNHWDGQLFVQALLLLTSAPAVMELHWAVVAQMPSEHSHCCHGA
jgi:hypothetical protein